MGTRCKIWHFVLLVATLWTRIHVQGQISLPPDQVNIFAEWPLRAQLMEMNVEKEFLKPSSLIAMGSFDGGINVNRLASQTNFHGKITIEKMLFGKTDPSQGAFVINKQSADQQAFRYYEHYDQQPDKVIAFFSGSGGTLKLRFLISMAGSTQDAAEMALMCDLYNQGKLDPETMATQFKDVNKQPILLAGYLKPTCLSAPECSSLT